MQLLLLLRNLFSGSLGPVYHLYNIAPLQIQPVLIMA